MGGTGAVALISFLMARRLDLETLTDRSKQRYISLASPPAAAARGPPQQRCAERGGEGTGAGAAPAQLRGWARVAGHGLGGWARPSAAAAAAATPTTP